MSEISLKNRLCPELPVSPLAGRHSHSNPAPLRVAMVSTRCFPFMGGIESHIHEVAPRLVALGHDLTVITTDTSGNLPREETFAGVRIVRVRAWPSKADYYLAPAIYSKIAKGNFGLVHVQGCHNFVPPIAMLAAIRSEVPFVVTFHSGGHSSPLRKAIRGIQWKALAPLVRQAAVPIGVSEFEADYFSEKMGIPRSKFIVVPNGAKLPEVSPAQKVPQDGRLIVSIGRLEHYKGHHRAIEAVHILQQRIPDVKLRILGSGPYEPELRRLISRLGLRQRVTIASIPPVERHSLAHLLSAADLVVLLSEYEAHPIAVLEALSLGRKVLTSDTSGFRELAGRGLIRAVSLKSSPNAIAAAMADALEAPPPPVGFTLPNWDDCAGRLDEIYRMIATPAI